MMAKGEKKAQNHFKLARDMRDTWVYTMKEQIKGGRRPEPLVQMYETRA
jgi:hypothetical protein